MDKDLLEKCSQRVRETTPLVHCITNYVTVNDCANALLAIGASPIMSDEPADVADITTICGGLVLNIGTLNQQTIEGMMVAGARASELGHPIVLDPVGAGASTLRTQTASKLVDEMNITVVRGNMSEMKALAGHAAKTRGVDVAPEDAVTEENLESSAAFARELAGSLGAVVAITGAIDIVADAQRALAIRNGSSMQKNVTGAGCMLTCVTAAYVVANPDRVLEAVAAAVCHMGLAGQTAQVRMDEQDGNASFRTYMIDALYTTTPVELAEGAQIQEIG